MKPADLNLTDEEKALLVGFRLLARQIADEALKLPRGQADDHVQARISVVTNEAALTSQSAAEVIATLLRSQVAAHRAH